MSFRSSKLRGYQVHPVNLTGATVIKPEPDSHSLRGRNILIGSIIFLLFFFGSLWVVSASMPSQQALIAKESERAEKACDSGNLSELCMKLKVARAVKAAEGRSWAAAKKTPNQPNQ